MDKAQEIPTEIQEALDNYEKAINAHSPESPFLLLEDIKVHGTSCHVVWLKYDPIGGLYFNWTIVVRGSKGGTTFALRSSHKVEKLQ